MYKKNHKPKTGEKTFIKIRSLKNYSKERLLEDLSKCDFPNYTTFHDIKQAYSDFIEKTSKVIDKIAPLKEICIRNNTAEWIDEEVLGGIKIRDKLFKKFKKSKSIIDNTNYKKARNQLQGLIKDKKRNFVTQKLTENISKPRELWKSLKNLGLPNKNEPSAKICLGSEEKISFDNKENTESFKDFYENLATNLVNELSLPTNKFGEEKIKDYYKPLNIKNENFNLQMFPQRWNTDFRKTHY